MLTIGLFSLISCDDSEPEVEPNDDNFPFRIVLDTDEGAALPSEEDYGLEVKFADYLGELPHEPITISYAFSDMKDSFEDNVSIDKITYKVELDDCEYEREIAFTDADFTLNVDPDLGTVPDEYEIEFSLPGNDDTEGGFVFELTSISSSANVSLNQAMTFEYEVLENDVAGEWVMLVNSEEQFDTFKEVFGHINGDLLSLSYADITGEIKLEFEFDEMKIEVKLTDPEIEEVCEDGETEEEEVHLEIEGEYDAEDGDLEIEGDHVVDNDGIAEELGYSIEASYEVGGGQLMITFYQILDEDNYEAGEALFTSENGITLTFQQD